MKLFVTIILIIFLSVPTTILLAGELNFQKKYQTTPRTFLATSFYTIEDAIKYAVQGDSSAFQKLIDRGDIVYPGPGKECYIMRTLTLEYKHIPVAAIRFVGSTSEFWTPLDGLKSSKGK